MKRALPGLLLTAAALVAGCSSSGPAPLGPSGGYSALCQPDAPGQPETVSDLDFLNSGSNALVVSQVVLGAPRHMRLVGTAIIPGRNPAGNFATYPPPGSRADWHRVNGYRVSPHQWFSVVTGLQPTASSGQTGPIEVAYTYDGTSYTLNSGFHVTLKEAASCT